MPFSLALFQPDIAQNTGTLLRLGACLGVEVHLIEPCGFPFNDRKFRRAGMDYIDRARLTRHPSWGAFRDTTAGRRLILLTTRAAQPYTSFRFQEGDILLLGRESAGVPDEVHESADARLIIPMPGGARSLNVAVAGAMVAGEAMRQLAESGSNLTKIMPSAA